MNKQQHDSNYELSTQQLCMVVINHITSKVHVKNKRIKNFQKVFCAFCLFFISNLYQLGGLHEKVFEENK